MHNAKALSEVKVTEYKGYKVYHVNNSEEDSYEVWKGGKQVGPKSFETDDEAYDFIDSLDENKTVIDAILFGKSIRESIRDSISNRSVNEANDKKTNLIKSLNALIGAWMTVEADYDALVDEDDSFADLFAEKYPFHRSFDELGFDIITWRDHIMGEMVK